MNIQFLKKHIDKFNYNCSKFKINHFKAWTSEIYCLFKFGSSPNDYFRYEFYRKNDYERGSYVTYIRSKKLLNQYNNYDATEFLDKAEFNIKFKDFIKRDWLDCRVASETEFRIFVKKYKKIILKPVTGARGYGILLLDYENIDSINFEDYRGYIAEELLHQHELLESFNPTSVNTVRVNTFLGRIVECVIRIGCKGSVVDNLNSGGLLAHIDIETGVIDGPLMNENFDKYDSNPGLGVEVRYKTIPHWSLLKETIEKASGMTSIGYVGWDAVILKDGIALIEANEDPGHVIQMGSEMGYYYEIKKIIKG